MTSQCHAIFDVLATSLSSLNTFASEEFLRVAESDMAAFPGRKLKDWESYWHGTLVYRDQKDFDHLFDALRKAGLPE